MRTLTTAISNATQATVTTPAYFVELAYSTVVRLSSRGDQSWNGQIWTSGRLGKIVFGETGSIDLINSDLAYSALILNEGAADIGCKVWKFYADNPAVDDPVLVFDGVLNGAVIGPSVVAVKLAEENSRTLFSPRRFISPATGFNHLRPAGSKILWNGQTYILERKI